MAKARLTSKKTKAAKKSPAKKPAAPKKRESRGRWSKLVKPAAKRAKPKKRATAALSRKATNAGKAAPEKESGYLAESGAAADQSYLGPKSDFPSTTGPGETLAETEETRDYVAALTKKAPESVAQGTDAAAAAGNVDGSTEPTPIPTSDDEATADDHGSDDDAAEDAGDDDAPI